MCYSTESPVLSGSMDFVKPLRLNVEEANEPRLFETGPWPGQTFDVKEYQHEHSGDFRRGLSYKAAYSMLWIDSHIQTCSEATNFEF